MTQEETRSKKVMRELYTVEFDGQPTIVIGFSLENLKDEDWLDVMETVKDDLLGASQNAINKLFEQTKTCRPASPAERQQWEATVRAEIEDRGLATSLEQARDGQHATWATQELLEMHGYLPNIYYVE